MLDALSFLVEESMRTFTSSPHDLKVIVIVKSALGERFVAFNCVNLLTAEETIALISDQLESFDLFAWHSDPLAGGFIDFTETGIFGTC